MIVITDSDKNRQWILKLGSEICQGTGYLHSLKAAAHKTLISCILI